MCHDNRLLQLVLVALNRREIRHGCEHDRFAAGNAWSPDYNLDLRGVSLGLIAIGFVPSRRHLGPAVAKSGEIIVGIENDGRHAFERRFLDNPAQ